MPTLSVRELVTLILLLPFSCGKSTGFGGGGSLSGGQNNSVNSKTSGEKASVEDPARETNTSGNAGVPMTTDAPRTTDAPTSQTFKLGPTQALTDYILVIDNSISMEPILEQVKNGIQRVIETSPNVFPPNSRMAVMSTMIGAAPSYTTTGTGINRYQGIDMEPGFLSFVNAAQIRAYKTGVKARAADWPLNGCEQEWFKPSDKDGSNNFCFTAALQTTAAAVSVEAGIHAFRQLLDKNKNKVIFRPNALVNVVFISDTHDPGANNRTLIDTRPTYADIVNFLKTTANKNIAGLKFHALAPIVAKCSAEELFDKAYLKIAADSGGEQADSCMTGTDYADFFRKMSASSIKREPIFTLEKAAAEILSVKVNNAPVTNFKISDTGTVVTIPGLYPTTDVDILIEYRPK